MLNFTLSEGIIPSFEHGCLDDPDEIVRENEKDVASSFRLLFQRLKPVQPIPQDWPDLLADSIRLGHANNLNDWASSQGLHAASLARGFGKLYGVSPARYRLEQRARLAWQKITLSDDSLSAIAHDSEFSDQAHMSRAVRALTGRTPGQWRRLKKFKN